MWDMPCGMLTWLIPAHSSKELMVHISPQLCSVMPCWWPKINYVFTPWELANTANQNLFVSWFCFLRASLSIHPWICVAKSKKAGRKSQGLFKLKQTTCPRMTMGQEHMLHLQEVLEVLWQRWGGNKHCKYYNIPNCLDNCNWPNATLGHVVWQSVLMIYVCVF